MVSAHPDCDMKWFEALDDDAIRALDGTEELSLIERRFYRWDCGCDERRMMDVLAPIMRQDADGLFGDGAAIRLTSSEPQQYLSFQTLHGSPLDMAVADAACVGADAGSIRHEVSPATRAE